MELPKIAASPDYEVFAPKITSKVSPGTSGMKGEILANYVVIPNKSGLFLLRQNHLLSLILKTENMWIWDRKL
jgi:hypothetical protein